MFIAGTRRIYPVVTGWRAALAGAAAVSDLQDCYPILLNSIDKRTWGSGNDQFARTGRAALAAKLRKTSEPPLRRIEALQ